MPSSRGCSQPRDQTGVSSISCFGRRVLYHYSATWEAQHLWSHPQFPGGAMPACQAPKGHLSPMLQTGTAPFLGLCWGHQVMCVQEPLAITC